MFLEVLLISMWLWGEIMSLLVCNILFVWKVFVLKFENGWVLFGLNGMFVDESSGVKLFWVVLVFVFWW